MRRRQQQHGGRRGAGCNGEQRRACSVVDVELLLIGKGAAADVSVVEIRKRRQRNASGCGRGALTRLVGSKGAGLDHVKCPAERC